MYVYMYECIYVYVCMHVCMYVYINVYRERSYGLLKKMKRKHDINHSPFVLIDCGELYKKEGGDLQMRVKSSERGWRALNVGGDQWRSRILLSFPCDLCVCMCICISIHICICICICICMCVYIYMYICICICICIFTYMCICMYINKEILIQ